MTQQDDITQRVLVDYEVYQEDELVASSNSLAHAEQYAEQYGQDGRPVEMMTCIRIDGFHAVETALLSQVRAPVADKRFKPPFDNCSFRMCDLPGQCRGEGRCHHPASAPVAEPRLEWSAKALYDAIKDVLLNHRLSNLVDEDGEFFPLVDHLRSQDDKTTESGEFEIALICDAIYNDVLTKSAPVAGEAQERIEQMAVNRYRPVPDGKFSYKVVAGDGSRSLYTGTKDSCLRVAAKLTEAFLDGAFVASDASPQSSKDGEHGE